MVAGRVNSYAHVCCFPLRTYASVIRHVADLVQADRVVATTHVTCRPAAAALCAVCAGAVAGYVSQVEGTPAGVTCTGSALAHEQTHSDVIRCPMLAKLMLCDCASYMQQQQQQ
jgi:hypothetical protein